ncbi:MAG TPA: VTT domain-containing protein [Bryobacteraceae bacterium]|nr:VTT domain-containing protein [Bryobacteraceae bacterium]
MRHLKDVLLAWGPAGIFVFAVIDGAGVPNPGGTDLLLIAVTIAQPSSMVLAAGLAVLGALVGSVIFYEIFSRGGERLLSRYTSSGRGLRFRAWFLRYVLITVFVPALLPIPILPFKLFAASACAMRVGRVRFLLVILAGRIPRYLGLAYLGATLGEKSWPWVQAHIWLFAVIAAALFLGLYFAVRLTSKTRVA